MFCLLSKVIQCNTKVKNYFRETKKIVYKRVFIEGKILQITEWMNEGLQSSLQISGNLWFVICSGLIQGMVILKGVFLSA